VTLLGHIPTGPVGEIKALTTTTATGQLAAADSRGWYRILESWAGAWQHNVEITVDNVTTHPAVFACATLIASDISKMRIRLVQRDDDGIWNEVENPAFSPVLRKPNHYQNRIQFYLSWMFSKLFHGNTYVLLIRDNRRVVVAQYVLDPTRVTPLVSPMGEVFYRLKRDDLSRLSEEEYTVPASELMHDRWNTFFHPLVGLSPIYAGGLAAVQGLNIQNNSTNFFSNSSMPGGILTAPGHIPQAAADRVKAYFDSSFTGDNAGKVAIVGDGLEYKQVGMTATDSQLIEQLKWSNEIICSVFHVPAYKVGMGPAPAMNNIEALDRAYYSQCLQNPIESIELCQDEGLGLTEGAVAAMRYGTEFDTEDLWRLDSATLMSTLETGKNYLTPNEGRKTLNKKPVTGGDVVMRQQQDYSLEALNKRDAQADPFATASVPSPPPSPPPDDGDKAMEAAVAMLYAKAYAERVYEPVAAV
jgi:HK97 family phage portal protein